ncbi:MAG: protoporphyrinogen oxidase [Acidobacteria bacterium]|nr:protoporphyrinogen oxidase [Acidobacteriota bacterium]
MIAIIGGGISGLAAAYELHRQGLTFHLFEQSQRLGGLILTEHTNGFVIEAGPDALLVQKPAGVELCRELGLGDSLLPTLPPRTAYIVRDGLLHRIPDEAFLAIPLTPAAIAECGYLSAAGKARLAAEPSIPPKATTEDESVGNFMRRRFGDEVVEYVAEPLLAGIHAGDVDRLSMQSLFPGLPEAERQYGSVLRAFRHTTLPHSADGAFLTLARGLGDLVAALARALPADAMTTGVGIKRITLAATAGQYVVHPDRGEPIVADAVIVATPAYITGTLLQELDPHLADHCRSIPYVSTASVTLSYAANAVGRAMTGVGFLVPRAERRHILAASWVSSKWPGRAPSEMALLRVFVGSARDTEILRKSDDELCEIAHRELGHFMQIRERPAFTRVYRWERASAQHDVGHLDRVRMIETKIGRFPGLFVTGSGFRGVGIPDCIADARTTAVAAARNCTSR